jgi:Flp pilus assembly protein TadB
MSMCPMAETCKGMMAKPHSRLALSLPGVVLIILGVLVIVEPRILVWLVAIALIVMGISMLMLSRFVRRVGQR